MLNAQHQHYLGFDVLFNLAAIGIIVTDDNDNILMINPFLLSQSGYAEEEITDQPIHQLVLCEGSEKFIRRKDGSRFPAEVTITPHATPEGPLHIIHVTDISDKKSIEQTLKDLQQQKTQLALKEKALQDVNSVFNNLWSNAGAMIIVTNEEGYIKWFNPAAERILGYKASEVVDFCTPMILHDKEEIALRAAEFSKQLNQEIPAGLETLLIKARLNLRNEYEWQYVKKDGTTLPVSLAVSALRNGSEINGYMGIAIDLTPIKQAESELRVALEKERDLNELKSRFVSLASHEFRTPLSAILSSIYLVSKYEDPADVAKRTKHIQRIISSVNSLTDILNDFLSVGKIEEGKIQVHITEFDPGRHIGNILHEMEGLKKSHQQIYYAHHGPPLAVLDPTLLKHIVMNLVSNAIKFSPDNAIISVRSSSTDNFFQLSVKDKGIGISVADRQHLFERFFRSEQVANIQGTGLGLHIVAKYTEVMNGHITCNSALDQGTEFLITIPFPKN